MHDIFRRLHAMSDPLIVSLRKAPKPKGGLDLEVQRLLLPPNPDGTFPIDMSESLLEEDDSDVDDRFVSKNK